MSPRDIPAHSPSRDHAAEPPHAVAIRIALGRLNPARAQSSAPPPKGPLFLVGSPRGVADRPGGSAPGPEVRLPGRVWLWREPQSGLQLLLLIRELAATV